MYEKCGTMEAAVRVFKKMTSGDVVSLTAMQLVMLRMLLGIFNRCVKMVEAQNATFALSPVRL
jgi:hypothetical protein